MKNRKLIRQLKEERRKLYPYGLPIQPRGYGKTSLHLMHFLRYVAFDVVIDRCKKIDRETSLEEAYEYMNIFIKEMWAIKEDFLRSNIV